MSNYGTVNGGDTYFSAALGGSDWNGASEGDKLKALVSATRSIDRLIFAGDKADDAQELQFPRDDDVSVPTNVEYATYELANYLLSGIDLELEHRVLTEQQSEYGDTKSQRVTNAVAANVAAGIPSIVAWRYLLPYLEQIRTVRLTRLS